MRFTVTIHETDFTNALISTLHEGRPCPLRPESSAGAEGHHLGLGHLLGL